MRVALAASLSTVLSSLGACTSKEVRYPEDHARFVNIDKAVEALRSAYVRKDLSAIQSLILPRESLEQVVRDIQQDFQAYQEIALQWNVDRIVIEGDAIEVVVNWAGEWRTSPADAGIRERGQGVLAWVGEQTILLNGVSGDLPFGMAARHGGSRPGPLPLQ
jgi:NAD(P)-dependent dehydrogenase (short-subunit alcohol dehydrogenase family)